MSLVPDLVTELTEAPDDRTVPESCVPVFTRNSCSASGKGNGILVVSNRLVCIAPSSEYPTLNPRPPAAEIRTPVFIPQVGEVPVCTEAPVNVTRSVTL